jgi:hypothetical protein
LQRQFISGREKAAVLTNGDLFRRIESESGVIRRWDEI